MHIRTRATLENQSIAITVPTVSQFFTHVLVAIELECQGPGLIVMTDLGTSHAYHHQEVMGPDTIIVRTILLDGGKHFKPAAEIYGKAKMGWEPTSATTHETLPPG